MSFSLNMTHVKLALKSILLFLLCYYITNENFPTALKSRFKNSYLKMAQIEININCQSIKDNVKNYKHTIEWLIGNNITNPVKTPVPKVNHKDYCKVTIFGKL